jgi:hypothetical protein
MMAIMKEKRKRLKDKDFLYLDPVKEKEYRDRMKKLDDSAGGVADGK